jgi:hypothetical protein
MGFFSNLRRSAAKSRLMKSATAQVRSGGLDQAVSEIWSFMESDAVFANVIKHFSASKNDVADIITNLMFAGAGGTYRGHFVPVSAVLFPDTFAYCLRAQRGQVSKAEAAYQVMTYFESGAMVFAPERAFHK